MSSHGIATVLDLDRMYNVIDRRTADTNINIIWNHDGKAGTDVKGNIYLPVPKIPVTVETLESLYGLVVHETGHLTRKDAFHILKAAKPNEHLQTIFNSNEDFAMEREVASRYAGDAKALSALNGILMDRYIEDGPDIYKKAIKAQPDLTNALAVMLLQQGAQANSWDSWGFVRNKELFEVMPEEVRNLHTTLVEEGWQDKLIETDQPLSVWEYSCDLYKRLYPEEEQYAEDQKAKGREGAKSGEGGESPDQMEVSDGRDDAKAGEKPNGSRGSSRDVDDSGKLSQSKEDLERYKASKNKPSPQYLDPTKGGKVISWKSMVKSPHNEDTKELYAKYSGIAHEWDDSYSYTDVQLAPPSEIKLHDYTKAPFTGQASSLMAKLDGAASIGNRVRVYMQTLARVHPEREKIHGRLDKRSIIRLAMPPIDGGEWNKKVFYSMADKKEIDTAVMVLVDWSGSMHGKKCIYAADAAGRLVHIFDRVLGIPVCVATFSVAYNGAAADIGMIKDFNMKRNAKDIAGGFNASFKIMSGNNDGDSLMWAYRHLQKRRERRRVMIVLSDGAPADTYGSASPHHTLKHVTAAIEKERKVELWGVGIMSNCVQKYYTRNVVVNDLHDINNCLFKIIKEGAQYAIAQR